MIINLVNGESNDDTGLFQRLVCLFFGKRQSLRSLNLYGISFNPPVGFFGVAFKADNYGDNVFVAADRPDIRFKDLEPGELKIGNYVSEASVYFKADGSIEIEPKNATAVTIKGNVIVEGTVTATDYNITGGGSPSYLNHVHSGVTTGPSNTGTIT